MNAMGIATAIALGMAGFIVAFINRLAMKRRDGE